MFNFFKNKEESIKVSDTVYISIKAKWQALFEQWQKNKTIVFIFWFEESKNDAETFFKDLTDESITLLLTREAVTPQLAGKIPVFAEHYPLENKEQEQFKKMNLQSVQIYSSLSEPIFKQFGAERIIDLMSKLGLKENEAIEHSLITSSIKKAQKKIEKNIIVEHTAHSQAEWLQKNNIF